MFAPIQSIVVWAHRRRAVVAIASALLMALSWLGVRQLSFDADVLSLLPHGGRAIPAFRTFLQEFGSLDQLFVVFTAPDERAIGEYGEDVDRWISALRRAPEIEWVDSGTAGPDRDWTWLAEHQLLLLRGPALQTALDRLRPDGMAASLAAARQLLTMPSSAVADLVRQDPLDLFGLLRQQLGGTRAGISAGIAEGGYVTPDRRRRLVILKPRQPPYDTTFSHRLMQRLAGIQAAEQRHATADADGDERPPMAVSYAGGYPIALETEAVVRHESVWNSVTSLILILPVLFIAFRSVWLLVCGPVPSGVSLVVVLGMMGLAGVTLSAAATGAAAMLFGLGIDGVVLMYVAHRIALADGQSPDEAIRSLAGPTSSMLLGMFTTAATFYGLAFVDFPSLRQLGLIIGHCMVACGLLTAILVPAMLPVRAPVRRVPPMTWPRLAAWIARRRRAVLVAAAVLTVLLGGAASGLRVNPSLDRLRATTPAAHAEAEVRRQFGLPSDVWVILQEGATLEPLLQSNERLADRIRLAIPGMPLDPASALLPSNATQARARETLRASGLEPAATQAALDRAAEAAGFRPGSLDPFRARLPRLLDPAQRLTFGAYPEHGLGDLAGRFVARIDGGWALASYAFPSNAGESARLEAIVASSGVGRLASLDLVNRDLARQFLPQFLRGLVMGSLVVVVLIAMTFRDWRLSLLTIAPTVVGMIWTAGLLVLARVELDLFAVFAVVTFVGIGIDYGIHLVHRYKEGGDAAAAVAQLAPVIVIAGLITLAGYGTLVASSYPPLRSIGLVSAVSVVALVLASVVVLPALLLEHSRR